MTTPWKPAGYPSMSPYLIVPDAKKVIAFMRDIFDATELRRYDTPDGEVMHAELKIDDSVVMIGQAGGEWQPVPVNLHVYVENVDEVYRRALSAGATPVQAPQQREGDPDRRGGFMDAGGNTWWVGTQLSPEVQNAQ